MANPIQNPLDDQSNTLPAVSPSMARLNALKKLAQLKSLSPSSQSSPTPTPLQETNTILEDEFFGNVSPVVQQSLTTPNPPLEEEEEVDWEALFAAKVEAKQPEIERIIQPSISSDSLFNNQSLPQPIDGLIDNPESEFLPPTQPDNQIEKQISEQISQALPDISTPELDDSSDFFTPPFEVLEAQASPTNKSPISTTKIVDQIQLKPEDPEPEKDSSKLEIIQSDESFPLTLTEDPTKPNPITQMLKKLQGQFGNQIKQAMADTRARLKITMTQFNNKVGDASNLEASLFNR